MKRLLATIRWNVVLQFRHGFYYVGAFLAALWIGLFRLLGSSGVVNMELLVPGLLTINLLVTTFFFMAGLVMLEKDENTLAALVTTPLREGEYLAAKVASLTLLAVLENALVVLFGYGFTVGVLPLLAGMALLSVFYVLLGFVAVARYDSINAFLLPSIVFVTLLTLPLLYHFALWETAFFYLHPVQPALVLLRAAFLPVPASLVAYGVAGSLLWTGACFFWARRRYHRFVVRAVQPWTGERLEG